VQHFISQTNHFSITRRNRKNSQKRVVWSDTHPKAQGGFNGGGWQRLRGTTRGGRRANKPIANAAVQNAPSPATLPKGCGRDIKSRNISYNRRYAKREKKHKESWRLSISRLNKRRARARPPSENTTTACRPQNPRRRGEPRHHLSLKERGEALGYLETGQRRERLERDQCAGPATAATHHTDPAVSDLRSTRSERNRSNQIRFEILRSSHLASAPEKPRTPLVSARPEGEIQRHQAKRLRRTENRNRERREPETRYRRWRRRPTRQACR
ncbi:hypothetical protein HID58_052221, partial [Brassica napus]